MITKTELIRGTRRQLLEYFEEFIHPKEQVEFEHHNLPGGKTHWLLDKTISQQLDGLMTDRNNISVCPGKTAFVGPMFFMTGHIQNGDVHLIVDGFWVHITDEKQISPTEVEQ